MKKVVLGLYFVTIILIGKATAEVSSAVVLIANGHKTPQSELV